jgi:hypothetical protein
MWLQPPAAVHVQYAPRTAAASLPCMNGRHASQGKGFLPECSVPVSPEPHGYANGKILVPCDAGRIRGLANQPVTASKMGDVSVM